MNPAATPSAKAVRQALREIASPERAQSSQRFFKSGPGEYAEGDQFIGVSVPDQRTIAKQFRELELGQIKELLYDPIHEYRLTAIFILVGQFKKARTQELRKQLCEFLLDNSSGVNNWDLVDSCAPQIIGQYLLGEKDRSLLLKLAKSKNMWSQRIAVVANQSLIKAGQFDSILIIAEKLLDHPHDLIHKAVGWMLREVGEQDESILRAFLTKHAATMPRTMLRYSIEKFSTADRTKFMNM
ncbi:MAG: DNA alkylation repair protein [Pirellulales bacterium]